MTEDEKIQAAAYIKLQDDVKQLIVDTITNELQNYSGPLQSTIRLLILNSIDFDTRVKGVIRDQMNKY
jgi:GTPase involved in cell partitioning and DNA repair